MGSGSAASAARAGVSEPQIERWFDTAPEPPASIATGKTTLVNKLMEWLRLQQVATAFIFNSRMNVPQFLDYMMADFGIPCDSRSKSQILLRLYNWLLDRYRAGETAVLIVDEAQNLSDEVLEEIRMMTNLETFTEKLLQIVMVGQPELEQTLKQPQMRQLRQRLTLRAKTHPLSLDETKAYVAQRLRIAGSNGTAIRTSPSRDCGSITGATCHTAPLKLRGDPTGVTCAGIPTWTKARSTDASARTAQERRHGSSC